MPDKSHLSVWNDLLDSLILSGKSIGLGIFNDEGLLLDANQVMCNFLDTGTDFKNPKNHIVNPSLEELLTHKTDGLIFHGLLTISDYQSTSYTLIARVFRRDRWLLIFAEADVVDLFSENKKMSKLNQEVNNLQRQLIKEKMNLQQTLNELKETQQMLVHSEKMNALGKLVAGVAHEINNPISFIYSNVFSLEKYIAEIVHAYSELETEARTANEPGKQERINEIREKNDLDFLINDISDITKQSKIGLERVKTIVEDLRKFSRLDEADMKHIDLIDNIRSTIGIASIEFTARNIRVELIAPEKLMVECFPGQLNQAVLNLLINAAQAIVCDGEISILVERFDSTVFISISDNGCGIPENIQNKIFDPFFTTKPIGSGTGLGLSITYKIITDLHKGNIEVDSIIGKGSTFKISIPIKQ